MALTNVNYSFPQSIGGPDQSRSDPHKFPGKIVFGAEVSSNVPVAPGSSAYKSSIKSAGSVTLFMPPNLNFRDSVNYGQPNLGLIGETFQEAVREKGMAGDIGSIKQDLGDAVKKSIGEAVSAFSDVRSVINRGTAELDDIRTRLGVSDDRELARSLIALTASRTRLQAYSPGISAAIQATANPHKRSIFQDVDIRAFNFSFNLLPMTQFEAQTIEAIVKFFRERMYPYAIGDRKIAYGFPATFNIGIKYKDKDARVPKFKPCYLQSMTTTYNPEKAAMFRDGHFSQITINLDFIENVALTREDIEQGY